MDGVAAGSLTTDVEQELVVWAATRQALMASTAAVWHFIAEQ